MKRIAESMQVSRSNMLEQKDKKPSERKRYNKSADAVLLSLIREIADEHMSYGCRVHALLNGRLESFGLKRVNHKRVYRIMHNNGLLLSK